MSQDIDIWPDFVPGWESRPDQVEAIAALQPIGAFEDSAAFDASGPLPDFVSLDDAVLKISGKILPTRNQGNAGTCVSFGTIGAVEYTMAVAIARGKPFIWHDLATEPVYGGSRVEVGKGRLGRGDGSIGAWAAEFVKGWGVAARQDYPALKIDLSQYSIPISRQWGNAGVPDNFEPILKQHPVQGIAKILTTEGLKTALANGYGVAESSGYLLRSSRNGDGTIDAYRGGGHCMCVSGYITIGGVDWFHIRNSWGDAAHTGPTHPKFPTKSGGLIHQSKMRAMLDGGDTWAFSDALGFPARNLVDWYV
jgi:hypothetical protein